MSRRQANFRTRRVGYSSGLTPKTIFGNNLVQWLRADLGVTTVSGLVSTWADQSGNNNNAIQNTAGNRPTYVTTGGANGGPHIFSDTLSATPWLDMSGNTGVATTAAAGWMVCIIYASNVNTGTAQTYWSTTTIPADGSVMQWRNDSGMRVSNVMFNVLPAPTFLTVVGVDLLPVNNWIATVMTMSTGLVRNLRVYGDGTSTTATPDTKASGTNIQLGTGRIFRDGAVYYQNKRIQEIIMVNRDIAAAELVSLKMYLANRGVLLA